MIILLVFDIAYYNNMDEYSLPPGTANIKGRPHYHLPHAAGWALEGRQIGQQWRFPQARSTACGRNKTEELIPPR